MIFLNKMLSGLVISGDEVGGGESVDSGARSAPLLDGGETWERHAALEAGGIGMSEKQGSHGQVSWSGDSQCWGWSVPAGGGHEHPHHAVEVRGGVPHQPGGHLPRQPGAQCDLG